MPEQNDLRMAPAEAAPWQLDVVSDAICPWCWVGKRQLERALSLLASDQLSFDIHWRPFQLNPDMPKAGVERRSYRAAKFGSEAHGAELDAQVAAAGAAVGLGFRHDRMVGTDCPRRAGRPPRHLPRRPARRAGCGG